jgi:hypothetical protein
MTFTNVAEIEKADFSGFRKMDELFADSSMIPKTKGVYFVLYTVNKPPAFLTVGTGGYFKDQNPNVPVARLKENWVDNTIVIYIGKAGKDGSSSTLQSRLREFFWFGKGGDVGHTSGRFIWQLKNSKDLVVCWKTLPTQDPRTVEADLIRQFVSEFGKRPYANLSGG